MTPAARATRSRRSGSARRRSPISAGARPPSSATVSASRWARSSRIPTSSASISGATRRSASPAWISRPRCASALPILSILSNNFSMAIELKVMPVSTEKYRSTDISGNYADFAKALGGYGERVTEPGQIKDGDQARHRADPGGHSRRCSNSSPRRRPTSPASPDPPYGRALSLGEREGPVAERGRVRVMPAAPSPASRPLATPLPEGEENGMRPGQARPRCGFGDICTANLIEALRALLGPAGGC